MTTQTSARHVQERLPLDLKILEAYFAMEWAQRQRLQMERLRHPEKFAWQKRGAPPRTSETTRVRIRVLAQMGFDEAFYQRMMNQEKNAKSVLGDLVQDHPLYAHSRRINAFGSGTYLIGAFVAAGGDIRRVPKVSSFWKGMGLDVLPDGGVPRRVRGRRSANRWCVDGSEEEPTLRVAARDEDALTLEEATHLMLEAMPEDSLICYDNCLGIHVPDPDSRLAVAHPEAAAAAARLYDYDSEADPLRLFVECLAKTLQPRNVPALPFVTKVGEQIRVQILRTHGKLQDLYYDHRAKYDAKYPDRQRMYNFKAALRVTQKILYACLWEEWRKAYGLPAPWAYAFAVLNHPTGGRITISDLYDN